MNPSECRVALLAGGTSGEREVSLCLQNLTDEAHKALGCAGASRSDFILDAQGNAWILETNTIPGMTSTPLLPDAARA